MNSINKLITDGWVVTSITPSTLNNKVSLTLDKGRAYILLDIDSKCNRVYVWAYRDLGSVIGSWDDDRGLRHNTVVDILDGLGISEYEVRLP